MSNQEKSRIFLSPPHMGGRELQYIEEAFATNYIAPVGPLLQQFEKRFGEQTGYEHCLAVSSGTAAIHLALRCLGVGPGDTVLASTLTFIGSVSSIVHLGATPVLIDCDEISWNMDSNLLEEEVKLMEKSGSLPAAVIPTDLYGQSCDLDAIRQICDPRGIPILSDSAEALGAEYKGKCVGKGARATAFSFNGNKIITTSGGGMLASDDGALIEKAGYYSTQTREPVIHFEHREIGYNYRMSNVLAGIGLGQLEVLEERVKRKREIFGYYEEHLGDLPGISFMPEASYGKSTNWLSVILIEPVIFGAGPEEVRLGLEEENIEARLVWKPMHSQEAFQKTRVVGGAVAENLFKKGLCLPSGTALQDAELDRIVDTIRKLNI